MKREIKFRGQVLNSVKDKKGNVVTERKSWVYGDLLHRPNGVLHILTLNEEKSCYDNNIIIPDTVGQFTGLFDNNKKEIYEGDIIRWRRDGKLYLVKFYAGMFYASVEELNKGVYGGIPLHVLTVNEEDEYKCEVCGNIYDNPDLLKGCSHE
jgi:uncharacterized phage protein (TIGR01671 family)